jgi:hypothetical protein
MPVRKPVSVKDKPIKSFDEITPEFLAEKERSWEEVRLKELTMANLKKVGSEFHNLKRKSELAEQECRLRAIRAINLGYNKKDLADAMGVDSRTITKWIK